MMSLLCSHSFKGHIESPKRSEVQFSVVNLTQSLTISKVNSIRPQNLLSPLAKCRSCFAAIIRLSYVPNKCSSLIPTNKFFGKKTKWLFARLPHIKCIRLGSVRSSLLPLKMHYVRSSLHVFAPTAE